jgi:hypothetical protein
MASLFLILLMGLLTLLIHCLKENPNGKESCSEATNAKYLYLMLPTQSGMAMRLSAVMDLLPMIMACIPLSS